MLIDFTKHYMCPMVKESDDDVEGNEEIVECYIFDSNGLIVINAAKSLEYRERYYSEDKFIFYLNAGYIRKVI